MTHGVLVAAFTTLAPTLTYAATYYVAKTGSSSSTCSQAQSASTPKLTVNSGIACLSAGDTLIVKTGVYVETIHDTIPTGSSATAKTRIIGDNGAKWTLRPTSSAQCSTPSAVIREVSKSNIEVADLIADANKLCRGGILFYNSSNDIYLHDIEVKNWTGAATGGEGSGIDIGAVGLYPARVTIRNVYSHDGGFNDQDHCFYLKGNDHLVEYVEGANCSGHGMHAYGGNSTGAKNNRQIIRHSNFHHNGARGILIGSGADNIAHHNISTNNGTDGIQIGFNTTTNNKVYNNTIYSNLNDCIEIRSGVASSQIKNNLCLSNGNNTVKNTGTSSIIANNRLSTVATLVVEATKNLFSPRTGSILIDAGETISGFSSGKFVGLAPDQGAIELGPTASPTIPSDPTNLQVDLQK
jgi:hypothetical protein